MSLKRYVFFQIHFEDISEYYNLYKNLMNYWKKNSQNDFFDLNYEDLINNPKIKLKKLLTIVIWTGRIAV